MVQDDARLPYLENARSQNIQLQEFPTGLTEVSKRLVCEAASSLDKGDFGRRLNIFLILVGASRPLTLEEVSVLLALRCLSGFVDDRGLFLDPKGEILRSCWPLVVVVDDFVQLIPISFKDFMNESPIGDRGRWDVRITNKPRSIQSSQSRSIAASKEFKIPIPLFQEMLAEY